MAAIGLGRFFSYVAAAVMAGIHAQGPARKPVGVCVQVKPLAALFTANGRPLPRPVYDGLTRDAAAGNAGRVDRTLREYTLLEIHINPESRVKVMRGPAKAELVSGLESVVLVRVVNEGGVTAPLTLDGPNLTTSASVVKETRRARWLTARLASTGKSGALSVLTGARLEYFIVVLSAREAGYREATFAFDVGQGTQDLGFRGECPVLFRCKEAKPTKHGSTQSPVSGSPAGPKH